MKFHTIETKMLNSYRTKKLRVILIGFRSWMGLISRQQHQKLEENKECVLSSEIHDFEPTILLLNYYSNIKIW